MYLKQSTAQTVRFGPFLDSTDGITAETALTIAQADMQLSKDGGAFAQKNASGNATHDADGWYSTSLDATDTATVGELILQVTVSGALPVWTRWYVVEEAIYDAFFAASSNAFTGAAGSSQLSDIANDVIDSSVIATGAIDADSIASNAITAAKIATDAITAAKIAADAIGASELATDAVNEIRDSILSDSTAFAGANIDAAVSSRSSHSAADSADAVWDEDATGHQTQGTFGQAIGDPGADTDTIFGLVNTNLDATVSSRSTFGTGDEVTLQDDAITAAKFDQSTAHPLASADSGSTQVARTGADSDTLETLSDQLDSVYTGTPPTANAIADQVAQELVADHSGTAGSIAERLSRIPNAAAGGNGGLPTVDANNRVAGVQGTINTLDEVDTAQDTQHSTTRALIDGIQPKKNTALSNFQFLMSDSTNHEPDTGLTVTAERSIDGAAFAACANSVTELANGVYTIDLAASDLNGDVVTFKFTATGADQTTITVLTQS